MKSSTRVSARCRAIGYFLGVSLLVAAAAAPARAGVSCFTIEDPDQRAYCRALQTKSAGNCSTISDYSLRQSCRARLSSNPSHCNSVTSQWERKKCQDEANRKPK